MKMAAKIMFAGLVFGVALLVSGCKWFEFGDEDAKSATGTVPAAQGGDPLEVESAGKWGPEGGGLPAKAGQWVPIAGVSFPTVYFAYDRDDIGTSETAKIDQAAKYLNDNSGIGLIIEGHCDERGTLEYNRSLGERRALAVKNYLTRIGVDPSRIQTQSFGEERPAVEGADETARSKNRRAELIPAKIQ